MASIAILKYQRVTTTSLRSHWIEIGLGDWGNYPNMAELSG